MDETGEFYDCDRLSICKAEAGKPIEEYIDWTHKYSLVNWILQLDLFCAPSFEIGFFGSCFFMGYICSCLVFPPLADKHGRKIFIIAVQIE